MNRTNPAHSQSYLNVASSILSKLSGGAASDFSEWPMEELVARLEQGRTSMYWALVLFFLVR